MHPQVTVDALARKRQGVWVSFVVTIFSVPVMVLAEGANSVLAERHGLVTRPAGEAMALGIKRSAVAGTIRY